LVWTCISCSSSGQYIIAGTKLNFLFLSSSYGINWNNTCNNVDISNPSNKYWNSVSISSNGQYIYAASLSTQEEPNNSNRDTIYISNNFSTSWISIENLTKSYWYSITCSSDGQYVYACSSFFDNSKQIRDGIYLSTNYGNDFDKTNATSDALWRCISCSSSGKYVIAVSQMIKTNPPPYSDKGNIYVSINFGETWSSSSGTTWSSIDTSSLFNGCAISSDGMYLTACSSTNIYNSVTPYSYIGVSNNFYSYGNNLLVGDVSLNSRLSVRSDVSFNRNLEVLGKSIFRDDVSMNSRLFIGRDVSMNSRLSVLSDVSFSQRLYVGGDVLINGKLNVKSYNANIIISTSTTNYTMIIAEDMSLNGRLFVANDLSINQRLYVTGGISTTSATVSGTVIVKDSVDGNGYLRFTTQDKINYIQSGLSSSPGSSAPLYFTSMYNSSVWMIINGTGNVGIGTTNPQAKLDIVTSNYIQSPTLTKDTILNSAIRIGSTVDNTDGMFIGLFDSNGSAGAVTGNNTTGFIQNTWDRGGASTVLWRDIALNPMGGNVGIGVAAPGYNLHVAGTFGVGDSTSLTTLAVTSTTTLTGALTANGGISTTSITASTTITATGQITGNSFNASSDQRIKTNVNDITGKFALDTLRNINPVSYHFIDDSKQKSSIGFIAQQIQKSLETSVSKQTRFIPNIYENIDIDNKTITLNEKFTTDISLCDYPVKLKFNDLANNPLYGTIDKIIDSKTFTLIDRLDTSLNSMFLYGQEVDDFLSINYDSVFTVVTGAVKQLDTELQETKQIVKDQADTIVELRSELSELKTQMSNIIRYLNNK
jgi:hypothetical protein